MINPKNILNFDDIEKVNKIDMSSKIQDLSCSIFVIHGKLDEIIPISFTEIMMKKLPKATCWYPKIGTHDNILNELRQKFYSRCLYFLSSLKYYITKDVIAVSNPGYFNEKNFSLKFEENYIKKINGSGQEFSENNRFLSNQHKTSEIDQMTSFLNNIPLKAANTNLINLNKTRGSNYEESGFIVSPELSYKNNKVKRQISFNTEKGFSNIDDRFFDSKRQTSTHDDVFNYNRTSNPYEDSGELYEYDKRIKEQEEQYELLKNNN